MCSVSMIMDWKDDEWRRRYFSIPTPVPLPFPVYPPEKWQPTPAAPMPTQEEIDEFRRLLDRAREYDRKNNEPDCELEEKRQKLRDLAETLGVEISFV